MPVTSGKTAGAKANANAALNFAGGTGLFNANTGGTSLQLDVPNLTRLSWVIIQVAGIQSILITAQASFRRGVSNTQVWETILPPALTAPSGVPLVLQLPPLNCQSIRFTWLGTGLITDAQCNARYYLSGSG